MTNFKKKAIALAAVACVAVTSAASCTKKQANSGNGTNTTASNNNSASNSGSDTSSASEGIDLGGIANDEGFLIATPFKTGAPENAPLVDKNGTPDLDADDPVEPATEIVESTDENGNVVTQIVTKSADQSYTSKTESRYCFWVDISADPDKQEDVDKYKAMGIELSHDGYVFNGETLEIIFKLKDNIPDKAYPVRFNPDLSTINGKSITPDKVIQGNIYVGSEAEAQDVSSETGFVAYGDNVTAKAGDEVVYHINLKNNPGLAGMLLWVYYDSNAMTVEDIIPVGEFATVSANTASTGSR